MPVDVFKLVKNTPQFSKKFRKNYNEDSDKGYFLKVNVQKFDDLHNDLLFLPDRMEIEESVRLVANLHDE